MLYAIQVEENIMSNAQHLNNQAAKERSIANAAGTKANMYQGKLNSIDEQADPLEAASLQNRIDGLKAKQSFATQNSVNFSAEARSAEIQEQKEEITAEFKKEQEAQKKEETEARKREEEQTLKEKEAAEAKVKGGSDEDLSFLDDSLPQASDVYESLDKLLDQGLTNVQADAIDTIEQKDPSQGQEQKLIKEAGGAGAAAQ